MHKIWATQRMSAVPLFPLWLGGRGRRVLALSAGQPAITVGTAKERSCLIPTGNGRPTPEVDLWPSHTVCGVLPAPTHTNIHIHITHTHPTHTHEHSCIHTWITSESHICQILQVALILLGMGLSEQLSHPQWEWNTVCIECFHSEKISCIVTESCNMLRGYEWDGPQSELKDSNIQVYYHSGGQSEGRMHIHCEGTGKAWDSIKSTPTPFPGHKHKWHLCLSDRTAGTLSVNRISFNFILGQRLSFLAPH